MTKEMHELIDRDLNAALESGDAKTALGVDDATAEELLARCVKEGY